MQRVFILCKQVMKADIVQVFSFTAVSTLVKMLTGLISVKVIASVVGPSGVALLGQLSNFSSIIMSLSSGCINSGITKYIAEYKNDTKQVKSYLSVALKITIVCSVLVGFLMILFHSFLSRVVMLSSNYGYVFVIFGFSVLFYALNMMLISVINGYKEFQKYVNINIANSLVGLIFTILFVLTLGLKGALISVVTYQSVMFFITLWMVRKLPWVKWAFFREKWNRAISKKYFHYTLMTLTTAATVPVSQILLRSYVISEISPMEAGWWEGMNRISSMYLMIITTSLGVYYLPRLSELQDKVSLRKEIFSVYKIGLPILCIGGIAIYLLRNLIIYLLFTPEFLPMESLFMWQLMGDFFKIASWLIASLMIAKAMTKLYVITEVLFSISYYLLGILFIRLYGVHGVVCAYFINYVLYLFCMSILFRKTLFKSKK